MGWIQSNPGSRQWFSNLMSKDPGQLMTVLKNFFGKCAIEWVNKSNFLEKKYGFCPPFTILITPSMRCNLSCPSCYSARQHDSGSPELDLKAMDRIIKGGKEIGVYFYTILGGEPLLLFDDLSEIANRHKDCLFLVFTNGTLITEEMADRLFELKNVIVAFRVNGTREDMESIRGKGIYDKVLKSMTLMKNRNLIYGISLVLTSRNHDSLSRDDFLNFWENQGIVFGWNFLFMPIGEDPDLSLMPTPQQRIRFGEFLKDYRQKHPLFLMDFWSDAPSLNGCVAGGRRFLHINNRGDVEPCIFARHSTHNIHNCTLVEALQSPFFTFIRMNQPHTDNLLRPCMIIDNPEIYRTACKRFHARPTQKGADDLIKDPELVRAIDTYSADVAVLADELWKTRYSEKIDDMRLRKRSYREGIDRIEFTLSSPEFFHRNRKWARYNPRFSRDMLEALTYSEQHYGTDNQRHIQIIKKQEQETQS
ncbi:MAG TPA: radical SAM protein [Deltaproteobacteria bacterium]|nr:radical SAM protein [Deltaproteobacteria bacterium]HPJ94213.1 radical SAM protein [Deltaproteobacteria bacterium]HPR51436.1 radical SAM protein [Deltaproteobacteria bacterium]